MAAEMIFRRQVVATARKASYYRLRFAALAAVLWVTASMVGPQAAGMTDGGIVAPQQLGDVAGHAAGIVLMSLVFVALCLTPAVMADVIVEEKQQRTLPDLLATRLWAAEVVFSKLSAQLLQVAVMVALPLPLLILFGALGGLEPALAGLALGLVLSTAYLIGGMSILASTLAKGLGEAIFYSYAIAAVWLIVPPLVFDYLLLIGPHPLPSIREAIEPWTRWVAISSPLSVWGALDAGGVRRMGGLAEALGATVAAQFAWGTAFALLAAGLLRRVTQQQVGTSRMIRGYGRFGWTWRLGKRSRCGDAPILWKESALSRSGGLTKLIMLGLFVLGGGALVSSSFGQWGWPAWVEQEMSGKGQWFVARTQLAEIATLHLPLMLIIWLIAVGMAVTDGWMREKLQDTWISLISTPLSGGELLTGKIFGALLRLKWLAAAIAAYLCGLFLVGALLLPNLLLALGIFATLTALVALACTWVNLGTATRLRTVLTWALVVLGSALVRRFLPLPPLLLDPPATLATIAAPAMITGGTEARWSALIAPAVAVAAWGLVAVWLGSYLFRRFDALIGRPDQGIEAATAVEPAGRRIPVVSSQSPSSRAINAALVSKMSL